jgi:hypothetical protein
MRAKPIRIAARTEKSCMPLAVGTPGTERISIDLPTMLLSTMPRRSVMSSVTE